MEKLNLSEEKETLLKDWFAEIAEDIERDYDALDGTTVEEIPYQSYDGFIPHTNGGFRIMVMHTLASAQGSGYTCNAIEPYIESSQKDAFEDWKRDNLPEHNRRAEDRQGDNMRRKTDNPREDTTLDDLSEGQRELFHEYEYEYMCEGGEFWYQVQAYYFSKDNYRNRTGEDEICIMAGVNTDFTYGRDKGLQVNFERDISPNDLNPETLESIAAEIHKTLGQ